MSCDSPDSKPPRRFAVKTLLWCAVLFFLVLPWQACGPTLVPLDLNEGLDSLRRGPGTGGSGNGDVYTGMRSLKTLARSLYQPTAPVTPLPTDEYHRFVKGQQCSATATDPQHAGLIRYLLGEWHLQANACSVTDEKISGVTIQSYAPEVLSWENRIFGLSERRDDLFTSAYPLTWCRSTRSTGEGLSIVIAEKIIDATPAGDGALTLTFPTDLTSLPSGVKFSRPETQPTATFVDNRRVIRLAAAGAPRIDADPVSGSTRGLLLEEARTNVALQSAALDLWTRSAQAAVTTNSTMAPDGNMSAETVALASSSSVLSHALPSVTTSTPFTFSIFVKATSGAIVLDYENGGSQLASAAFDLSTQKPSSTSGSATARLEPFGKWLRLILTFDHVAGASPRVRLGSRSTGAFAAWGAQIEAGGYATSYIPTTSQPVERKADSLVAENLKVFDGGIGALFVNFSPLPGQSQGTAFDLRDATDRSWSADVEGSNLALNLRTGVATTSSTALGSIKGYGDLRLAFATSGSNVTAAVSGALRVYQSPVALGSSRFTSLTFGRSAAGDRPLSGHLRRVTQWNHELAYGTLVHTSGFGLPLPLQGQISLGDATALDRRQVFNFQVDRQNSGTSVGFVAPDYDFDLRVTRAATTSTNGTATVEVAIDDRLYKDELTCVLEPGNIN